MTMTQTADQLIAESRTKRELADRMWEDAQYAEGQAYHKEIAEANRIGNEAEQLMKQAQDLLGLEIQVK